MWMKRSLFEWFRRNREFGTAPHGARSAGNPRSGQTVEPENLPSTNRHLPRKSIESDPIDPDRDEIIRRESIESDPIDPIDL